jgi:hypothetical protein
LHGQREDSCGGIGTFDEVNFCPPIYPVRHIYSMKREGASEGIGFFVVVVVLVFAVVGTKTEKTVEVSIS